MKIKIGKDEFCLHCMEWQEYDEEGRCRVCKHIIHRETKKHEKEGYNELKSKAASFDDLDEDIDDIGY